MITLGAEKTKLKAGYTEGIPSCKIVVTVLQKNRLLEQISVLIADKPFTWKVWHLFEEHIIHLKRIANKAFSWW